MPVPKHPKRADYAPLMASPQPRTRLSPDERRTQLVTLGVGMLADHPLDSITIDSLAAAAGVSRGLVFHYFGSRTGLHQAIVATARTSMLRATEPRPDLEPIDRLHDTLVRIIDFVREYRGTFHSLIRGTASGDAEVRTVVEEVRTAQHERVLAVFLELGMPDTELLRLATRSWVALAEQLLIDGALGSSLPADVLVRFLEESLRGTVAAASAAARPAPPDRPAPAARPVR